MTFASTLETRSPAPPSTPATGTPDRHDRRWGRPVPRLRARLLRRWPLLVLAGWLVQAGIRLALAWGQAVPVAFPDESGYLIAARWIAGGPGGDLSGSTFYQGGYPLLLAPAFWVSHDPQTCYRIVLGINAFAGAAIFPLAWAALRRLGLGRAAAYGLGFAVSLLPAATVFGMFALTDAILPVLLLGWALALHSFLRTGRTRRGGARTGEPGEPEGSGAPAAGARAAGTPIAGTRTAAAWRTGTRTALAGACASLAAAYAYTVHARGTVVLAVHVVVLAGVLVSGFVSRRATLAAAAVTAVAAGAGWTLNSAVRAALYPGGVRDLGGLLTARLGSVDGIEWTVFGGTGQIWYLIVATWGLAGVGLVAEVRVLVRRRCDPATRIVAGVLLAATVGAALASSAALPDEHRVGNFVYGRYLACLAVAHALAGLAALIRRRASAFGYAVAAGVVLIGAGLSVTIYAGSRLGEYHYIAFDFPETAFLTWDWGALRLGTASLAALGLLWLSVAGAFTRRPAAVLTAGLVLFHLVAAAVICKPWGPDRVPIFRPGPPRGGVAVDAGLNWRVWVRQAYQVSWAPLTSFHAPDGPPPAGVCMVIVPVGDGAPPERSWPRHPAGWRVTVSGTAPLPWAAWQPQECHRPVT